VETRQGTELLLWLLQSEGEPRPLKDLYYSSKSSPPTIRALLRQFLSAGLIAIEIDPADARRRLARGTPKLNRVLSAYVARAREVAGDWVAQGSL